MSDEELTELITKVNEIFYDKLFDDPWLSQIFVDVDQDIITSQQTDFIVGALGGPQKYCGRSPKDAHPHIFIQEDMWDVREAYMVEALKEANAPEWISEKWLKIDNAFKAAILKGSIDECSGRYKSEEIINIPNPNSFKKAA